MKYLIGTNTDGFKMVAVNGDNIVKAVQYWEGYELVKEQYDFMSTYCNGSVGYDGFLTVFSEITKEEAANINAKAIELGFDKREDVKEFVAAKPRESRMGGGFWNARQAVKTYSHYLNVLSKFKK